MSDGEFSELVEDVRAHGVRVPILVADGQIADGVHRWKAAKRVRQTCPIKKWDGKGDLMAIVISLNLNRRHMNAGQKACVAADAMPMFQKAAKERQKEHGGTAPGRKANTRAKNSTSGKARDQAAKAFGVGGSTVGQAKGLKEADPEEFDNVKRGEKTLGKAVSEKKKVNQKVDWGKLEALAAAGNTTDQIAKKLGVGRRAVWRNAKRLGVNVRADKVVNNARYPKPDRILSAFVNDLESLVPSCKMINPPAVKREVLIESLEIMEAAMLAFSRLRTRLRKEVVNG